MGGTTQTNRGAGGRPRWLAYLIGLVSGLLIAAVVGLFAALPLALSHRSELPLERAFGGIAVSLAARLNAGGEANPVANDAGAIETGRTAYVGSCAVCHGAT